MSIKNNSKYINVFCIILFFAMSSCHSSQELFQPELSLRHPKNEKPKFIEDIALSNNTSKIKIKTEGCKYVKESPASNKNPVTVNSNSVIANDTSPSEIRPDIQSKYANILGVRPTAITNLSLYNFVDDWYGVKYRMGGNDKNGIDCSAFAQKLYESVFCANLVRTAFEQYNNLDINIKKDSLKEGDLVFFGTKHRRRRKISHVGVYLKNNYFVHASSSQGVTISSLDDSYWARKYVGAGEIENEIKN